MLSKLNNLFRIYGLFSFPEDIAIEVRECIDAVLKNIATKEQQSIYDRIMELFFEYQLEPEVFATFEDYQRFTETVADDFLNCF